MIARLWRGWAPVSTASAYETHFRHDVLPHLHALPGFRGADLLRRKVADEVEFVVLTRFDSLSAIQAFAGKDYEAAVVAPAAQRVLSRFESRCIHYEIAEVDGALTLDPQGRAPNS